MPSLNTRCHYCEGHVERGCFSLHLICDARETNEAVIDEYSKGFLKPN